MKSIIPEDFANQNELNIKGWNMIKCDICGTQQMMTRAKHVSEIRKEAKDQGWQVAEGAYKMDLCQRCRNL